MRVAIAGAVFVALVDAEGDAFFIVFGRASDAVAADGSKRPMRENGRDAGHRARHGDQGIGLADGPDLEERRRILIHLGARHDDHRDRQGDESDTDGEQHGILPLRMQEP